MRKMKGYAVHAVHVVSFDKMSSSINDSLKFFAKPSEIVHKLVNVTMSFVN